jgi:hypothetical protein
MVGIVAGCPNEIIRTVSLVSASSNDSNLGPEPSHFTSPPAEGVPNIVNTHHVR